MSEQKSWIKPVLETGPLLLFFVAFMFLRNREFTIGGENYSGFVLATLIFIPVLVVSMLILWRLTGRLQPMQIVTLVLVVVFGGLTVWLNDPKFFKMKPTLIYLIFGTILLVALLLRKNWLGAVLSEALTLTDETWRNLTLRLALLFFALAGLNEIVWRSFSETTWVSFKTFGLPLIMIVFLGLNAKMIQSGMSDDDSDS